MRRWSGALALAALLALGGIVVQDVIVPSICESLTPDNWILWKLFGCDKDSAGGGGGGAG